MGIMLENIKVIEIAPFYPGPFCTQILAEHGAEVIKIEPPTGDPMRFNREMFAAMNRNKKSVTLNLKNESDLKKFYELVKRADVIVEGFRPGVAKKLRIDYDSVRKHNNSIIYCSISGFGQTSSLLDVPVHDINVLSFAGICRISGLKDGEPRDPNVQFSDFTSAVFATISILMALIRKEKTGEGAYIDVSMMDSAFAAIPLHTSNLLNSKGDVIDFMSNPGYEIYRTKDGYISLGIMDEPHFWRNLCTALEIDDSDIDYSERIKRYQEIKDVLSRKFIEMTNEQAFNLLRQANVPFGLVNDVKLGAEIIRDRGIIGKAIYDRDYLITGFPAIYSNFEPLRSGKVPELGEDNHILENRFTEK
jgi:crotonobetainyl-CoA:carnitine CoA-transferase CaiB-like acyl-CoA transferase